MPVLARAGQPRHLQAQHQPHMAHREFCDQPREPGPLGRIRGRPPQVLIDHHHPGRRPAQRDRPVCQPVLQPRRLAVVQRPAGATIAGHRRSPAGHAASPGSCPRRAHRRTVLTSAPLRRQPGRDRPPLQEHAQQSQNVVPGRLRKRRPQLPVRNTRQPPSSGEDARARAVPGGPPPGPRARSCPAHSTSRSSPSLPISGVLTAACPTIHAL